MAGLRGLEPADVISTMFITRPSKHSGVATSPAPYPRVVGGTFELVELACVSTAWLGQRHVSIRRNHLPGWGREERVQPRSLDYWFLRVRAGYAAHG